MKHQSSTGTSPYVQDDRPGKADAPPGDLDARSRRWQRTGNAAALWPGLDLRTLDPAARAIEQCTAACLHGQRAALGAADGRDATAIGIAALVSGVGPLLGYWIERGNLDASSAVAAILAEHLAHGRARMQRIHDGVRPALAALVDAGIAPSVIKGFHTAHVYFPDPGVRPIADVDVVVTRDAFGHAERALAAVHFTPGGSVWPYKRDWYPAGIDRRIRSLEMWHADSPWYVELHGGLVFGELPRYGVVWENVLHGATRWETAGVPVSVLSPPLRLTTLAAHLSSELHSMRLLRLVELILIIRRDDADGTLDWAAVEQVMDRAGAARFLYPSFSLVERLSPGTVDARIMERVRRTSTRLGRRVVAALTPATPILSGDVSLAQRLMWASTPGELLMRLGLMLRTAPGSSWTDALRIYYARVHRVFAGRVGYGIRRRPPAG
jgi:hypothetical protein